MELYFDYIICMRLVVKISNLCHCEVFETNATSPHKTSITNLATQFDVRKCNYVLNVCTKSVLNCIKLKILSKGMNQKLKHFKINATMSILQFEKYSFSTRRSS